MDAFLHTSAFHYLLAAAWGYLMGSIPFGLFAARLRGIADIRQHGSGNIGATNITRVIGKKVGLCVLLADGLKGAIVVWVLAYYLGHEVALLGGALAVIGHMFPIWLHGKGGKGVATTLAVLLALHWPIGLASIGVWVMVFFMSRISSLAAILAMISSPTFALYFASIVGMQAVYLIIFLSILVISRHHTNIRRLLKGEEKRIV